MPKIRNYVDPKVLERAAKWSKPHLKKRYIHGDKVPTVALARKYSKKSSKRRAQELIPDALAKEYAADMKMFKEKAKKQHADAKRKRGDGAMRRENARFADSKRSALKSGELSSLEALAWTSVMSSEQLFDGCPKAGAFEVISSSEFAKHFDLDTLKLEEATFGSAVPGGSAHNDANAKGVKAQKRKAAEMKRTDVESKEKAKAKKSEEFSDIPLATEKMKGTKSGEQSEGGLKKRKKSGKKKSGAKTEERHFRAQIGHLRESCTLAQVCKEWSKIRESVMKPVKATAESIESVSVESGDELADIGTEEDSKCCDAMADEMAVVCTNDCCALGGFHKSVLQGVASIGFQQPTEVQRSVLAEVMKHPTNDLMIAAPTGSGKTLAFGIAMLNDLMHFRQQFAESSFFEKDLVTEPKKSKSKWGKGYCDGGLMCLILTPTRELALQIEAHLSPLLASCGLSSVSIVGGMSIARQRRVVCQKKPAVAVATPGRLWQLMDDSNANANGSKQMKSGVLDVSRLRYLIIDEADRLLSSTHFSEMESILDAIRNNWQRRNQVIDQILLTDFVIDDDDDEDFEEDSEEDDFPHSESSESLSEKDTAVDSEKTENVDLDEDFEEEERDEGLSDGSAEGGEELVAKRQSFGSALSGSTQDSDMFPLAADSGNGSVSVGGKKQLEDMALFDFGLADASVAQLRAVRQQRCVVVSATLTLESVNRDRKSESRVPVLANLLRLVPLRLSLSADDCDTTAKGNQVSVIDLSAASFGVLADGSRAIAKVSEYRVVCDGCDKDAIAFYLCESHEGNGRTLVFCNTVGSVRRCALLLKKMSLKVWALHSSQQQKQRLKNLDRFVKNEGSILVCTDLAARGLDIPSVDRVLHFHVPQSTEDYIHRRGRAWRRHGSEATLEANKGVSILLICARELATYKRLMLGLRRAEGMRQWKVSEAKLAVVRKRMRLVEQISAMEERSKKDRRKISALEKMAMAADIELDEMNAMHLRLRSGGSKLRGHRAKDLAKSRDEGEELRLRQLKQKLQRLTESESMHRKKSKYLHKDVLL